MSNGFHRNDTVIWPDDTISVLIIVVPKDQDLRNSHNFVEHNFVEHN
jgi:hypothetical protein